MQIVATILDDRACTYELLGLENNSHMKKVLPTLRKRTPSLHDLTKGFWGELPVGWSNGRQRLLATRSLAFGTKIHCSPGASQGGCSHCHSHHIFPHYHSDVDLKLSMLKIPVPINPVAANKTQIHHPVILENKILSWRKPGWAHPESHKVPMNHQTYHHREAGPQNCFCSWENI